MRLPSIILKSCNLCADNLRNFALYYTDTVQQTCAYEMGAGVKHGLQSADRGYPHLKLSAFLAAPEGIFPKHEHVKRLVK